MTWTIAVAACALIIIAAIVGITVLSLKEEQPHGRHARVPFADPQDTAHPEQGADEYVAALRAEPETALILTAPAAETAPLEPLPLSPLDRRERTVTLPALPSWEPPVDRGTLESVRDALRAWNPAGTAQEQDEPSAADLTAVARDQEAMLTEMVERELEPDPEPEPDWLTTSAINAFAPVLELGGVDDYLRRVFAPAEEAVRAVVAEHLGSDEKGDFAGASVAGLRDWDLSAPVALTGKHHATGDEAA